MNFVPCTVYITLKDKITAKLARRSKGILSKNKLI